MKMPNDNDGEHKLSREMLLEALAGVPAIDNFELELFEWYAKETDTLLSKMLSEEIEYIKSQYDSGCGSDRINDSGIMVVEYYIKRIRYSHAIYLTSLLETFLKRSCDRLERATGAQNLPFSMNEIRGDQWETKRKFLERYGRFSVPEDIWLEIHILTSIRNNLVHDNGETSALSRKVKDLITGRIGLNIEGSEIVIEKEYISHAFDAMKSLFECIEGQIEGIIKTSSS